MGFDYWYDLDAIRKAHKDPTSKIEWHKSYKRTLGTKLGGHQSGRQREMEKKGGVVMPYNPAGKNPGDAVEIPPTWGADKHGEYHGQGKIDPKRVAQSPSNLKRNIIEAHKKNPKGRNPGDYWSIVTKGFPGAHFAVFPEDLIEPIIKSSCPPDGIVLDPFCGSGTTNLVAMKLGRKSYGIDINKDYIKIAQKRCRVDISSLQDFGGEDE
jgi:hypothetical protein